MYDNDNYSGIGSGEQATGAISGAQGSELSNFSGENTVFADSNISKSNTSVENNSSVSSNVSTGSSFVSASDDRAEDRTANYGTYHFSSAQDSSVQGNHSTSNAASSVTPYFNSLHNANSASGAGSSSVQADSSSFEAGVSRREGNSVYSSYDTYQMGNSEPKEKAHKEKKSGGFFQKAILAISLGLFFGLFAGLGFYAVQQGTGLLNEQADKEAMADIQNAPVIEEAQNTGIKLNNTNSVTVIESDISEVVEEVMPAMVSIVNNYTESTSFWGQTYTQQAASSGSGIIVAENDTELLIVSNNHVVVDSDQLMVTFIDGSEAEAHIKGLDSDMDLAVIAVALEDLSEETKKAIAVSALGDSDNLKLGEPVIAIGNALGYGQSVTTGIVSALDREITMDDGSTGTFIQTDAAINPGNSGGALLNMNGEVIGINSNKIGGTAIEGMGYAIPITSASPIIADLMERQTRNKVNAENVGYMGISMQEVTEQISMMYNMPEGIYIIEVQEGSAAQKAGLMRGDIIIEFDGDKITAYEDLQSVMQYYAVGDSATVTVMRPENGQYVQYDLPITLGERPKEAN